MTTRTLASAGASIVVAGLLLASCRGGPTEDDPGDAKGIVDPEDGGPVAADAGDMPADASRPLDATSARPDASDAAAEPDAGNRLTHAALLERRSGSAREVTGAGADADTTESKQVWVTNTNDSGAGSLRAALSAPGRWVRFDESLGRELTITLRSPITPAANITLDGRGTHPIIATAHRHSVFDVSNSNQIYVNLDIVAGGADQDAQADCFSINGGSSSPADNIWIHHCSMTGVRDKRVGISFGARVTIDWCEMYGNSGHGVLVGCRVCSRPDVSYTTMHHNYMHGMPDRYPRVSDDHHAHAYNNLCEDWDWYAMGAVRTGHLLAENNWFVPTGDDTAIKATEGSNAQGYVKAAGNVLNGGTQEQNQAGEVFTPSYVYSAEPATEAMRDEVKTQAGWQPTSYWMP